MAALHGTDAQVHQLESLLAGTMTEANIQIEAGYYAEMHAAQTAPNLNAEVALYKQHALLEQNLAAQQLMQSEHRSAHD